MSPVGVSRSCCQLLGGIENSHGNPRVAVRWTLSWCVNLFRQVSRFASVLGPSLRHCMMSMTLWLVMPVLLSDLMMVWRCLVCSLMVCALCVSSIVLFPCVVFVQQEPKTKRGIGGIKIFPPLLPTVSAHKFNLFP